MSFDLSKRFLNRERATALMEREQLDVLIAHRPENFYYSSNYWGVFNTARGYDGTYFTVIPRDPDVPAAIVVPALEIRRLETRASQGEGTWIEQVYAYSSDGDGSLADGSPLGQAYTGWPVADNSLVPLEESWVAITRDLGTRMSPNAFWALTRALTAVGLDSARIGADDARTGAWLAECGLSADNVRYCPQLFNEIRLIKTPAEIEIMRMAAVINENALLKAARSLYDGIGWQELEDIYMAAMAGQGGRGVYLMCGMGELPKGKLIPGEPVFFDALGQYRHYHGDFGRSAVVGNPAEKHKAQHAALLAGWDAAQEYMKPGISYSALSAAVGDAVRKAGIKGFRDPMVHGLGLEHTDDPKPFGVQPQTKEDQVLQQGMVINVDMPHTEIGWGSVHMEDTVVITADGFERLGQAGFDLVVVD